MAKGSGTTRSGGPGSPRGLIATPPASYRETDYMFRGEPVYRDADNLYVLASGQFVRRRDLVEDPVKKDIKAIQKATFRDMGGGMWELNTPHADVSILLNEDYMGGRFYSINGFGAENVRTGDYSSDSVSRPFSSLNAAKQAAKEELEKYYRKVNG